MTVLSAGTATALPPASLELAPSGRAGTPTAHVRMEAFDGPLALLLALIEARELDVLSVPLGELSEEFLAAVARLEGDRLASLSGFVAVAAQLILIKSRALLPGPPPVATSGPTDEGVDPEEELRRRLLVYRAFRDAGSELRERLVRDGGGLFHREAAVATASAHASARASAADPALAPPEQAHVSLLVAALERLARLAPPVPPPAETFGRTISIEERTAILREALRAAPLIVLQDILHGVRDRVVAAVTFLAMLELVKRREIVVEQAEPWGRIVCRRLP